MVNEDGWLRDEALDWAFRFEKVSLNMGYGEGWVLQAFHKKYPMLLITWCHTPDRPVVWSRYPEGGTDKDEMEAFGRFLKEHIQFKGDK